MGPTRGPQDPGGPHDGPMNFAIWDVMLTSNLILLKHSVFQILCNFDSVLSLYKQIIDVVTADSV